MFCILQGDLDPPMVVTALVDNTPQRLDTATSIQLCWRKPDGTISFVALTLAGDVGNGAVRRTWGSGDTDQPGEHYGRIVTLWPDGKQSTFPNDGTWFQWKVAPSGIPVNAPVGHPSASYTFASAFLATTFTDTSTDSTATIVSWAWDFGDSGTSTLRNPVHTFAAGGTYSVRLTVTDSLGFTSFTLQSVTVVANQPPVAAFTAVTNGLVVSFTDTSTDADGTVVGWHWDFGDGNTSTLRNPSHAYATAGTYQVILIATDNLGATGSVSHDEVPVVGRGLIVYFGQSNAQTIGLVTDLTDQTLASAYPNVPYISRQDGNTDPPVFTDFGPGVLQAITWNGATKIGLETTSLRDLDHAIHNGFGCARFALGSTNMANWNPTGTYPLSQTSIGQPNLYRQFVNYVNAALVALGCTHVAALIWDQGEADATSSGASAAYQSALTTLFAACRVDFPAVPIVICQLNNDFNNANVPPVFTSTIRAAEQAVHAADSNTALISLDGITLASGLYDGIHYKANGYVYNGHQVAIGTGLLLGFHIPPYALFTTSSAGDVITFTDTSVSYGSTVTAWHWDFGDSNTSTTESPVHTYGADGTYTVALTVTDANGLTDTKSISLVVSTSIPGVTRDAASNIYFPATPTEWTTFRTATGLTIQPTRAFNCQESSGSPADMFGGTSWTPLGTVQYNVPVTGLTRTGIATVGGGTSRFTMASGLGANPATTSSCMVLIMKPTTTPPNGRTWGSLGANGAHPFTALITGPSTVVPQANANGTITSGTQNPVGVFGAYTMQNALTANRMEVTTPQEKIVSTFQAITDGVKGFGANGGTSLDAVCVYAFTFEGATGGEISAANLKAVLTAMGLPVAWS